MSMSRVEMEVPNATTVALTDDALVVELSDGRRISVPLTWFPRLLRGAPEERNDWRLIGSGQGIHWNTLDEDISVENLLAGRRSGESQESYKRWLAARPKSQAPQAQGLAETLFRVPGSLFPVPCSCVPGSLFPVATSGNRR
jgi:hypothetical protein